MTIADKFSIRIVPYIIITTALCSMLATVHFGGAQRSLAYSDHLTAGTQGYLFGNSDYVLYYQPYITPDDKAVKELASQIEDVEEAYRIAVGWIYVSEKRLNSADDKWLSPREFLTCTPEYSNNPVPGKVVGDCEEQACSLVSLIRAIGVPAEDIRLVLGTLDEADSEKGHVWVELLTEGKWLALDPSQGPYWDDETGRLIYRQGIPFDYYVVHDYPVRWVSAYYNDVYYMELSSNTGNAPDSWRETPREEYLIQKENTQVDSW